MGIGKRIKEAREHLGLTQNELAELVGVTGSAITNYEKETSHPKEPIMYKLFDALQVDASYLFQDVVNVSKKNNDITIAEYEHIKKYRSLDDYGKELVSLVLDKESERVSASPENGLSLPVIVETDISQKIISLPYYRFQASAGNGIYQIGDTVIDRLYLKKTELSSKATFIMKVSGESMAPDYHDDDLVMVSQTEPVNVGDVGIFIKNGDAFIKERGEQELISRNPEFANIPVNDSDNVVCLGKVLGVVSFDMILRSKKAKANS